MSKAAYKVTVDVQAPSATLTAAGSKSYTYASRPGYGGIVGWGPFERQAARSWTRTETGPGVQTVAERFVEFRPPFPPVERGDHLVIKGVIWTVVKPPRVYARTMQVDIEQVT